MENSYGIGVRNRYELFYDDEMDPMDMLKKQTDKAAKDKSAEKENKVKAAPKAPAEKKAAKKDVPPKTNDKSAPPG